VCLSEEPLVNGNNPIPDASMTASSDFGSNWEPHYARLYGTRAWCASDTEFGAVPPNFYIQVSRIQKEFEIAYVIQ